MGVDIKNPVFIELYGMPGCGKTAISHACAMKMRKEGYVVFEPNYELVYGSGSVVMRQLRKAARTLHYVIRHMGQLYKIRQLVRQNGYNAPKSELKQLINVIQKMYIYNSPNLKSGIYIWDQGITQCAISLAVKGKKTADENERLLWDMCNQQRVLKVHIAIEENVLQERLNGRSTSYSRLEQEEDPVKRAQMRQAFWEASMSIRNPDRRIENSNIALEDAAGQLFRVIKEWTAS